MYGSDDDIRLIHICRQFEVLCTGSIALFCDVFLDKTDEILEYIV